MLWGRSVGVSLAGFVIFSLAGLVISVFSSGLLGFWLGLEISFFGSLPLLVGSSVVENQCCTKYYVIQVLGSVGFFFSVLILVWASFSEKSFDWVMGVFFCFILWKLGLFPFFWWVKSVVEGLGWLGLFWVLVVQKMGLYWLISGGGLSGILFFLCCGSFGATSLLGGLLGLGQVKFRSILAYSSLVHSGWMGFISLVSCPFLMAYFMVYGMLMYGLLSSAKKSFGKGSSSDDVCMLGLSRKSFDKHMWGELAMWLLSIGGFPPLLGFVLKVCAIFLLSEVAMVWVSMLALSSSVSVYYYLWFASSVLVRFGGGSSAYSMGTFVWFGGGQVFWVLNSLGVLMGTALFLELVN
uniref:NADH-ubiquinone oxidoreductase chain 2 n=1 Tax=Gari togata TaxID=2774046 RepID=A0A8K0Z4K5_9BIVA|nr:NADH dehydrogenase subunit 2 [Gari togata]